MPESLAHTIKDFWAVIVAFVGFVAWLVRLEFRAVSNTKDLKAAEARMKEQRAEDLARQRDSEDRLVKRLDELGADIRDMRKEVQEALRK